MDGVELYGVCVTSVYGDQSIEMMPIYVYMSFFVAFFIAIIQSYAISVYYTIYAYFDA
jgi:hypothetical protein